MKLIVTVDVIGIDETTSYLRLKASANRTLHHFV